MFELLKKKLSSFSEKLKKTIEKKETGQKPEGKERVAGEAPAKEAQKVFPTAKETAKPTLVEEIEELTEEERDIESGLKAADERIEEKREEPEKKAEEPVFEGEKLPERFGEKKRELKARVGIGGKLKAVFKGFVELKESDLSELLTELELSLLEADVEQSTAEEIAGEIRKELLGKKIATGKNINELVKQEIRSVLQKMMGVEGINLFGLIGKKRPFVILFLGPNGAGKTTTIAKLTFLLQGKGKKVVWAAADTFRAASIEQLEKHAEKLRVRVVKHKYGADPAAVAFDAVKAAEAGKIDVVLIDSAGRQETNRNLIEELKKIARVAKPDLKVYIGEALTGQALLQQASEFNEALGIDAFILTKIDCDTKGGTTISLLFKLKKPILFVGTGQKYENLLEFKPEFVIEKIV